jgi:hypothetical protein
MQMDDQGLVNTDPRTIAVPDTYVNLVSLPIQLPLNSAVLWLLHGLVHALSAACVVN